MKTLINKSLNPYFNLALEEYLLKDFKLDDDLFFVWRNEPCVVIGRNQNPFNEIHTTYASAHNIPIIRRISGGGAVYHDLGNINFTYVTTKISKLLNNYRYFINPIISILERSGLDVRFVESSHIYLGDTKISGNAQSFHKNQMIHHGTLLFDTDLTHLANILKPHKLYQTHAVDSTRSTTTNIKQALQVEARVEEFMEFLLSEMMMGDYDDRIITLTEQDIGEIETLAKQKYRTWNWNIGETPEFWINEKIDGEMVQLYIVKGMIRESSIYPDVLEGLPFDRLEMITALEDYPRGKTLIEHLFI